MLDNSPRNVWYPALVIAMAILPAAALETSCCGSAEPWLRANANGDVGVVIGNANGVCCEMVVGNMPLTRKIPIYSATKMVTGYVILKLIDEGKIPSVDTRVGDLLDWWSTEVHDIRSQVTIRHLLSQTDGFRQYPRGLGNCVAQTVVGCAQEAYNYCWKGGTPGSSFDYTETSFAILGAVAITVTNPSATYEDVWKQYMADPLGVDTSNCYFSKYVTASGWLDPGGALECTTQEYAKMLQAWQSNDFVTSALEVESEKPQTLLLHAIAGDKTHYGFAQWRECYSLECKPEEGVWTHSCGLKGYYPWKFDSPTASYWGIVARLADYLEYSTYLAQGVHNRIQKPAPVTITTTTTTTPSTTTPGPTPSPPPACTAAEQNCQSSMCCSNSDLICYEKDQFWSECMHPADDGHPGCVPGIHSDDAPEYQTPWSCMEMATAAYVMLPDQGRCADSQAASYPVWVSNLDPPHGNAMVAARCAQYCTKLGECRGFSVKAGSVTCMLFFQWDELPASMPVNFYGQWTVYGNNGQWPYNGAGDIKQVIFEGGVSCFYKKRNLGGQHFQEWMIGWETTPEPTQQPFGPPSTYSTVAPNALKALAFSPNFTSVGEVNSSTSSSSDRKLVMLDHMVSAGEKESPKFVLASMFVSLVLVIQKSM